MLFQALIVDRRGNRKYDEGTGTGRSRIQGRDDMKKCVGCGKYISDFDRYCPYCEADNAEGDPAYAAPEEPGPEPGPEPAAPFAGRDPDPGEAAERTAESPRPDSGQYPMKWHRFLMFTMIVGAVFNTIAGISFVCALLTMGFSPQTASQRASDSPGSADAAGRRSRRVRIPRIRSLFRSSASGGGNSHPAG